MIPTVEEVAALYFKASRGMDPDAWADLFAEDAVAEDPVGQPPHVGKGAIRAFLASIVDQFTTIGLTENFTAIAGRSAAVKWTGEGVGKNGRPVKFEGIDVLNVGDDGKIESTKAYWDPGPVNATLALPPKS